MYELKNKKFNPLEVLAIGDDPPSLYELMESEVNYDNPNPVTIENLPAAFRPYLFDFDYPLKDEYKENFELMFLNHYMFRRIGFETYLSFKIHLKVKLNSIMPKYDKMFLGFSLLDFEGDKEIHSRNESESGASSGTSRNDNRFSNLPQNEISAVQNGSYMTDYTLNQGTTTGQAERNTNENITILKVDTNDEYDKFMKYANNIYDLIFKECDALFYSLM